MRVLAVALLACACGGPPPPVADAGVDAGHQGDGGAGPPAQVTLRWTRMSAAPYACKSAPTCLTFCSECTEGSSAHWNCESCVAPPCAHTTVTQHCCSPSAFVPQASLSWLGQDYPGCTLTLTAPLTYTLECGTEPMPQFGAQLAYTGDAGCDWGLPYRVH